MYSRSCVFVRILTVMLIHENVFSRCDSLKTKSSNHLIETSIDGYQRQKRQAPIDLSRMYLPPKIDAVAFSGFGGQVDASKTFGDNINGYGEVGLDQDIYGRDSSVDSSTYETLTKAKNSLNGAQTTAGPYGLSTTSKSVMSSFDQSTGYNILTPEGNNFGQNVNKNNEYIDLSSPGTSSYDGSSGKKSSPNNDITAQAESTDSYGRSELLNTVHSHGISQNSYNKLAESGTFSQNTGAREQYTQSTNQNTANGYNNKDPNTLKMSLPDNNRNSGQNLYDQRNNGNFGSSENRQLSGDGHSYKNMVLNSSNQKPTNGIYDPIGNAGYSYNQPSTGFVGFSTPNYNYQNNPSKSAPQTNNGNYNQYGILNTQSSQVGEYNQKETSTLKYEQPSNQIKSNQDTLSTPQSNIGSYISNTKTFNSKFGESSSQISAKNGGFEQNPTNSYNRKPTEINQFQIGNSFSANSQELNSIGSNNELQPGTYLNLYGQSSPGIDRFNQKSSSNYEAGFNLNSPSSLQMFNSYGHSGSNVVQNGKNYGHNVPTKQGQQNLPSTSNYDQLLETQSRTSKGNFIQSSSNSPINGEYNQGGLFNYFGQSQLGTPQTPNSYSQTESQLLPSRTGNYGQSGLVSSTSNGYTQESSYSSGSSQSHGINDVGKQNPLYRGNSINNQFGPNQGTSTSIPEKNRYAQILPTQNSLRTIIGGQRLGQESTGSLSNYGHSRIGSCASLCSKTIGRNSWSNSVSTGSSANPNTGNRSQKKYSTLVPKGQYQNSNLPSQGDIEKQGKGSNDNSDRNYGEPGPNAFSNFAPGNLPNQPSANNDQPGPNAFSNFAPGNLPNQPPANDDQPGPNAFSNFAPGNLPNQPPANNDQPGPNAFSNFAPGNFPNRPPANDDQPGPNAFSNFAPGNLPNQPPANNDQPGPNAFSNFAPGNSPNRPSVNNDQPNINSNLNIAPGNQQNLQPPSPVNFVNSNDCGKSSDHSDQAIATKQTEAVFLTTAGY